MLSVLGSQPASPPRTAMRVPPSPSSGSKSPEPKKATPGGSTRTPSPGSQYTISSTFSNSRVLRSVPYPGQAPRQVTTTSTASTSSPSCWVTPP